MPRAAIDIGSNTLLLLVVDDDGNTVHDEARVVGLGQGLGVRGMLKPDRMDAALEVLRDYADTARSLGVPPYDVRAAATSAARRALNARAFLDRVQAETQFGVQIVSGEREALLTWRGAAGDLRLPRGPVAVVDLGGGSTELVQGEGAEIRSRVSLEVGSVRLTEQFFGPTPDRYKPADLARLREAVDEVSAGISWERLPRALVAVAGTATTLAAMERGLTSWDRTAVHGMRLTRGALRRQIDRLLHSDAAERRTLAAVSPARADYLLAGAVVLDRICASALRDSMVVSDGGVRHGLLAH
jgi:exopolyphosphatase/guanosine-5'-triphosphate,3'-diphosphate pyrophosphatase